MADGYSPADAKGIVDVSQRCLEYWDERGLVRPSIRRAKGKGTERRYSYRDLVALSVVKRLRDTGLSLQKVRKGLARIQTRKNKSPLTEVLITDGRDFFWKRGTSFIDILAGRQMVFSVIAIGHVHDELRELIELPPNERRVFHEKRRRRASSG
jgi:DNA-binding transcriptional MerR regulator